MKGWFTRAPAHPGAKCWSCLLPAKSLTEELLPPDTQFPFCKMEITVVANSYNDYEREIRIIPIKR